jgi:chromosome segregation ATPase
MLVVFLLLSLTTFSQNATSNEPQVCMPASRARKVAQDLLRLDSLAAEHNKTLFVLERTQTKLVVKDSIISSNEEKIAEYLEEIGTHKEKYTVANNRVTELQESVSTLQTKNENLQGWIKGLGGGLIATMTTLITIILVK